MVFTSFLRLVGLGFASSKLKDLYQLPQKQGLQYKASSHDDPDIEKLPQRFLRSICFAQFHGLLLSSLALAFSLRWVSVINVSLCLTHEQRLCQGVDTGADVFQLTEIK
jgi:hypothetical protein